MRFSTRSKIYHSEMKSRAKKGGKKSLKKAGQLVQRNARGLMKHAPSPRHHAPRGKPPYIQTGTLKDSIEIQELKDKVVVGPTAFYGRLLEFGIGRLNEHPFMQPALKMSLNDLPKQFEGSFS